MRGFKWAIVVAAIAMAGIVAPTASASTVTTVTSSASQDMADTTDTSLTDGYDTVAPANQGTGARQCSSWSAQRAGYDLFNVKQWSETNHYHWCYYYGGDIYYRVGYDTQYVAPFWTTKQHSWAKGWIIPFTSANSVARATFDFQPGSVVTQESSTTVCRTEGDKGGTKWC